LIFVEITILNKEVLGTMAYGDYIGMVVADFPGGPDEINEFAKDVGIDITDDLIIIGFTLFAGENHPKRPNNEPPEIDISLLAVRKSTFEGKFTSIAEYFENEKEVQVVEFDTGMNLKDFHAKYLKRFEGRMLWGHLQKEKLNIKII
jgi:hypothetical protein